MSNFDVKAIREELEHALSRSFDTSKGIAVYGAGGASILAKPCFEFMEEESVSSGGGGLKYFIDDTPSKHGTTFYEKPVVNFEEAHELCRGQLILVSCFWEPSRWTMLGSLRKNPIEDADIATLDEYIFCRNSTKVLDAFDMLEDDFSKATYANMLMVRMGKATQDPELVDQSEEYFALPQFSTLTTMDVLVDCGAYVGDTVEQALKTSEGVIKRIYAFEPDRASFEAMKCRTERLKREWKLAIDRLVLVEAGIGAVSKNATFLLDESVAQMGGTFASDPEKKGKMMGIVSLDDYFEEQPITFIKADIESFEYPMLCGAKKVICRDHPRMAITIYHNAIDMFRIALTIKEICPDYQVKIRQHKYSMSCDTVLYAYVNGLCESIK